MAFSPLSYARPIRSQLALRLNEDEVTFRVLNIARNAWKLVGDQVFVTESAAVIFTQGGTRVSIHTHPGRTQSILIADSIRNIVIGRIRIEETGRQFLFDDMAATPVSAIQDIWEHRTLMIIGIPGYNTMNIRNLIDPHEDLIRYDMGSAKWFVPPKYRTPTIGYDVERPATLATAPESQTHTTRHNVNRSASSSSSESISSAVNIPNTPSIRNRVLSIASSVASCTKSDALQREIGASRINLDSDDGSEDGSEESKIKLEEPNPTADEFDDPSTASKH